ncbi:MAG: thymidine phosphorylase [spirochete symbiont of Stewartia floridana]|nr:MAG: thymidine phosphorylase [spirochete symbiont of Stewartia floridana]
MRAVDIIADKRDGKALGEEQIASFISGYARGDIPDYQAAAWCMAVFLKGMTPQETGYLTKAMIDSGDVINLLPSQNPFVDKHSTGGVGDKISLILAPIAAACGAKVPMMSGRALGHTGGTLDKLESIPGYTTAMSPQRFSEGVESIGYAMTGQSDTCVPADRKLYALRDVIAAVESIPLITGSILSKKFAEGADTLVMDVKCGAGAFMKTIADARELARSLVLTGKSLGRHVIAVITDMSEPLGRKIGNFLEVEEAIDCLKGQGPEDVMETTYRLTAWLLVAAGLESDITAAERRCQRAVNDGSAMRKFRESTKFQGGDLKKLDAMAGSARARYSKDVVSSKSGYLAGIDAYAVGLAGVALGIGRNTAADTVEALAGIELLKKTGEPVTAGDPVMRLWAEEAGRLEAGEACLEGAIRTELKPFTLPRRLILEEISE